MRRFCFLFGCCCALSAHAWGDGHEHWERFKLDFHRNRAWPEPFRQVDRDALRTPFLMQIDNGWQLQNTIDEQLFDPHTHVLSRAGEAKVEWIVTQAPAHRRTVFVLRGRSSDETHVRVDSVQHAVAKLLPAGPMPTVLVSDVRPFNGTGDYQDQIDRRVRSSIPNPRLPAFSGTGSGSGSGGGSSGGASGGSGSGSTSGR